MSINNKNANGESIPAQTPVTSGTKGRVGSYPVTNKGTGGVSPTDKRLAQSDGVTLGKYQHQGMSKYYVSKAARTGNSRKGQRSA